MIAAGILLFFCCLVSIERLLDDGILLLDATGTLDCPSRKLQVHLGRACVAVAGALVATALGVRSLQVCLVGHGHIPGACPDLAEVRHLCFDALSSFHGTKTAALFLVFSAFVVVLVSLVIRTRRDRISEFSEEEVTFEDSPIAFPLRILLDSENSSGCRVVGLLSPVIVLPNDFEDRFSRKEQNAAILHEIGHIQGGDPWIHQAAIIYRSTFAFLPGPSRLLSDLRAAMEERADDWAVRVGGACPRALASSIARSAGVPTTSLALAGDPAQCLLRRIERLQGRPLTRSPFPWGAATRVLLATSLLATGWLKLHCLVEALV